MVDVGMRVLSLPQLSGDREAHQIDASPNNTPQRTDMTRRTWTELKDARLKKMTAEERARARDGGRTRTALSSQRGLSPPRLPFRHPGNDNDATCAEPTMDRPNFTDQHHGDVSETPTHPAKAQGPTWMFYDGGCGVCHSGVKFTTERDHEGAVHFAPLGGPTHQALVPTGSPAHNVDTVVVVRPDGTVLVRSDAVAEILTAIGGRWGAVGRALHAVPRPLRDAGYDLVARNRKRLAKAPSDVCPILPPAIRNRFSD